MLAGAVVEQALESGADGGFVGDAEVVELAQGGVVILDRLVRRLQFQPLHPRLFPCESDAVEVSAVRQAMASKFGESGQII